MTATSVRPSGTALSPTDVRRTPIPTSARRTGTADVAGIPVAASTAVRGILSGPVQPAVVMGAPAGAVYLRTEDGELIAVVSTTAARLPLAAVAGVALPERPASGQRGCVGAGRIDAGRLSAHVVRWWDPRPVIPPVRPEVLATRLARLTVADTSTGLPAGPLGGLRAALHYGDDVAITQAASALIGLGPGLTPSGDDVVIGLVSALVCLGHPESAPTGAAVVAAARERTTDLSLALLRHASLGYCIGAVGAVLQALAGSGELLPAQHRLLAVGHSSGPALCLGVLLGAAGVARA